MSHNSSYLEADTGCAELCNSCRDVARFDVLCHACPGYGRSWLCPPIAPTMTISADSYDSVRIIGLKIARDGNSKRTSAEIMQRERIHLERKLLALEQTLHGRAAGLSGKCPYCGNKECSRIACLPCRHPDCARPSLEALGFNVEKIASDYLKTKILWEHDGVHPEYLLLVGAVFY